MPVATVESLWRYPVKSMRGEELPEGVVGAGGIRGDRVFAFHSSAARPDFPYFTGREQRHMLLYRPRLRQAEAGGAARGGCDVETPLGETLAIEDPALIEMLRAGVDPRHGVTLLRSEIALADSHPVSLISVQTVQQLEQEIDTPTDKRCFRANIYLDLVDARGFAENEFVGRSLRIGPDVVVAIAQRDLRCAMITIHPDTAAKTPALLKQVARDHEGAAGVYGSVVREGTIRKGDAVELLD